VFWPLREEEEESNAKESRGWESEGSQRGQQLHFVMDGYL